LSDAEAKVEPSLLNNVPFTVISVVRYLLVTIGENSVVSWRLFTGR